MSPILVSGKKERKKDFVQKESVSATYKVLYHQMASIPSAFLQMTVYLQEKKMSILAQQWLAAVNITGHPWLFLLLALCSGGGVMIVR